MASSSNRESLVLFLGDLICFNLALWPLLFIRYYGTPYENLIQAHLIPFSILFLIWAIVFLIAGLYEKQTRVLKEKTPSLLIKAQITNALIAVSLFYLFPQFGIEPRANLFIYILISSPLIFFWRVLSRHVIRSFNRQKAVLVGGGEEVNELVKEISGNNKYPIEIAHFLDSTNKSEKDLFSEIYKLVEKIKPPFLIIDTNYKSAEVVEGHIYKLMQGGIRFIDINSLYEDIFDRVRLSSLNKEWLVEYNNRQSNLSYEYLKRITDIFLALLLSIVALPFILISILVLKIFSPGPAFISQDRVGKNNKLFPLIKLRSWLFDDKGDQELHKKNKLTPVGSFLRQTRLDEFPQLLNVLKGELSFIGPRPEILKIVKTYELEVPHYNLRHIVKPGLSGWAQINDYDVPRGVPDVEKTKRKLSYDLYYLKHHSFLLDLKIVLRTIKTLLSRSGK